MAPKEPTPSSIATISTILPDRTTMIAFFAYILLIGSAPIAIRLTYVELPPFYSATVRFFFGAVFFWIAAWIRRVPMPRGKALIGAILFGVFGMGLFFGFNYWGLVKTPASLYQTILALIPLLTLFFALFHRLEPFHRRGLFGALLTVVGIIIGVGGFPSADLSLPHILAIIAGAACMAEAGIIAKIFPRNHPFVTNAVAMTVGAFILGTASFLSGEKTVIPTSAVTWLAFAYIVVFVTVIVFLLFLFILGRWTASSVSYSMVLSPLITITLASWLAKEQITWQFMLGGTLVMLGVGIGALLPSKQKENDLRKFAMNNLQLRNARDQDRDTIQSVTLAAYEQYAAVMQDNWKYYQANIVETLSNVKPAEQIVAENDNGIVGTVLLYPAGTQFHPPNGTSVTLPLPEIRLLAVAPSARGQGIGQALVQECIRRARETGVAAITLHTSDMMSVAMKMYERLGFVRNPAMDFSPGGGVVIKGFRFDLKQG